MSRTKPSQADVRKYHEIIEARRNAFSAQGARDISYEGDVRDDHPAWMAEDASGHRVVYRIKDGMFDARALHGVGRYFALRNRPLQPPGKYTATARFSMWSVDRPDSARLDNVSIAVPYVVPEIIVEVRGERLSGSDLHARIVALEERERLREEAEFAAREVKRLAAEDSGA